MQLEISKNNYVLTVPLTGENITKVRQNFPEAVWRGTKIVLPVQSVIVQKIQQIFPEIAIPQDFNNVSLELLKPIEILKHGKEVSYKTEPLPHQLVALEYLKHNTAFALFMEMGTGKTKTSIDDIAYHYINGNIRTAIVIAPNGVHRNWADLEIPKHMPDNIDYLSYAWDNFATKESSKNFQKFLEHDGLKIFTVNYEALNSTKNFKIIKDLCVNCIMILDESTRIKNPYAKTTVLINGRRTPKQEIKGLRDFAKIRRILTGTPITNSPLDLYSQCYFLNPEYLGFRNFIAFRNTYAIMKELNTKNGNKQSISVIDRYVNTDELSNKIQAFSYRVMKSDCLDLKPKKYLKVHYNLSSEEKERYTEMREQNYTELVDLEGVSHSIVAQIALTKMLRLRQLLGGFVTTETGDMLKIIENSRLKTLKVLLSQLEGKTIIWAVFREEIKMIDELLGAESVMYYGGISRSDRSKAILDFQNGNKKYFIGNPRAAGLGLTLTSATNVVYYSNDYSLELRQQSEDRAHRHGQLETVSYYDLIARGTIDEKIILALRNKQNIARLINKDNITEWI